MRIGMPRELLDGPGVLPVDSFGSRKETVERDPNPEASNAPASWTITWWELARST